MKKNIIKFASTISIMCMFSSVSNVGALSTVSGFGDTVTVYQECERENQYIDSNGLEIHEYIWKSPSQSQIQLLSSLDDATWQTTNLSNNVVVNHRGAKEYSTTSGGTSVWNAHAETKAYRNRTEGIYNYTTVRIVNAIWPSQIYEEKVSEMLLGHTEAITSNGANASEFLFAMRSYWSTDF